MSVAITPPASTASPAAPPSITGAGTGSTPAAPGATTPSGTSSTPATPGGIILDPRTFTVSGSLTGLNQYDVSAPVNFPLMIEHSIIDGKASFDDGESPARYLASWDGTNGIWHLESVDPSGSGGWIAEEDVELPWLVTTWVANSPASGTPILSYAAVTAPGAITPAASGTTPPAPAAIAP